MANERRAAALRKADTPQVAPPLRDRLMVVDGFLPLEMAQAMRADIETHFANPNTHKADTHQVWNYWFVPDLYAYLRTQPEKVIQRDKVQQFMDRLTTWSIMNLGLTQVTWPYLSLYVPGCRQNLHNDSVNGRFGFVFSLTKDQRRTTGGETIVHREGDPFRALRTSPAAGNSFFDAVLPAFNRLVVFDDRIPHAVERVDGVMDPVEGRFVLHGHIAEGPPAIGGALPPETAMAQVVESVRAFTNAHFLDGYHGPLTLQLDIGPDGVVTGCRPLLDRVIHDDVDDPRWAELIDDLLDRLRATRFPTATGPTRILLPVLFGARLPQGG